MVNWNFLSKPNSVNFDIFDLGAFLRKFTKIVIRVVPGILLWISKFTLYMIFVHLWFWKLYKRENNEIHM